MKRHIHNPWTWQDRRGFVQANEVQGADRILFCSGQVSFDADGRLVHAGDMLGQIEKAIDNLEEVLASADMTLADVMRVKIFTTDCKAFLEHFDRFNERLDAAGCQQASTLIGVAHLAHPDLLLELEATAAA